MNKLTPIKAIRKFCLECANTCKQVRECNIVDCVLYPYRMGKRPKKTLDSLIISNKDSAGDIND